MCYHLLSSPPDPGVHALAILHIDHNQNIQFLARDINVTELELSPSPSLILPPTSLSSTSVVLSDFPPSIITVPSLDGSKGGILIVGGRVIEFFELSSDEWQEKYRDKQRRTDNKKKSADQVTMSKAREKEREREAKLRKPRASIDWPWYEVVSYVPFTS